MSGNSPGLIYGQSPTAEQWNSYFAQKQDYSEILANVVAQGGAPALGAVVPLTGGVTMTGAFNVVAAARGSAQPAQISQVVSNYGGTINGGLLTIGPITNPDTQGTGIYGSATLTANRAGDYEAYSIIQTNVTFSASTPLQFSPEPTVYGVVVATYVYPPTSSPGVSGFTYIVTGQAMQQQLPPGQTMQSVAAQFTGGPLLPPVEVANPIITNQGNYLPTSVSNAMCAYEIDHQLAGGFDDIGARTGFVHNLSVDSVVGWTNNSTTTAGGGQATAQGIPTVSASFESIGLSPGSINMAVRAAGNVQIGMCARDMGVITAQVTVPVTTVAATAPTGTPAPAAAPAPISGGAVVHIGPTSSFTGYYSGLVGFAHGIAATGIVSAANPLPITLNGNIYHVIGITWDGPGYNSGYLQLREALLSGDGTVGQLLATTSYGLLMANFQAVGWEPTGAVKSYYDPTQFGSTGAVVTTGNVQVADSLSIGTSQALTGSAPLFPLNYSPRDGGHWFQWNPFTNQTEWYDNAGGTSNLRLALNLGTGLNSPLGINVAGKELVDANGNTYTAAGHFNANYKVTALSSAAATYTVGTEQLAILTYTGAITSLTVTLPTPIGDGDTRRFTVSQAVASLVVKNAGGSTLSGFPTSVAQGAGVTCLYDTAASTWYAA